MRSKILFLLMLTVSCFASERDKPYRVEIENQRELSHLSKLGAEIGVSGKDWVKIYATDKQINKIKETGFQTFELVDTSFHNMMSSKSSEDFSDYHTYGEIVSSLADLEWDYETIAEFFTIGNSVDGRSIPGIKISSNVSEPADKPEMIMISTMHGDEPVGTEFILAFADSLTSLYGTDPVITRLVDSVEIYLIPLLNPDGYTADDPDPTRRNSNDVDLNRNFPVPDGGVGDDGTFSTEAETDLTMAFLANRFSSYTINFHTGALVTNYGWDYMETLSEENALFIETALAYTETNLPMYNSHWFPQGITNGYAWYEVDGTLQDWDYWQNGALHLTVELSSTKWPAASALQGLWNSNYESFCTAVGRTLLGVRGIVTDSISGEPLGADVVITGLSTPLKCDPSIGDYHKMLLAGTYELTFSYPEYLSQTISVIVPEDDCARLDVRLVFPLSVTEDPRVIPNNKTLNVYPNPFNASCQIHTDENFKIFDVNGILVHSSSLNNWVPNENVKTGMYTVITEESLETMKIIYLK